MHVKKGDIVVILSGDDKGVKAKIIRSLPREGKVLVEGVNVIKRHERSRRQGQKGQIVERPMPIHASSVALADKVVNKAAKPKAAAKSASAKTATKK